MSSGLGRLALLVFLLDAGIILLYVATFPLGIHFSLFDLAGERNFGAWWGGGKYLLAGALLAWIPLFVPERAATRLIFYIAVAAGLVFLSADEILSLHERLTGFNKAQELGIPMIRGHGAWMTVYAVVFVIFVLVFLRPILMIMAADPRSSATICGGLATVVLGGVGVEIAGYVDVLAFGSGPQVFFEETLEQLGASLVVLGCAQHVRRVIDPTNSPTADRSS